MIVLTQKIRDYENKVYLYDISYSDFLISHLKSFRKTNSIIIEEQISFYSKLDKIFKELHSLTESNESDFIDRIDANILSYVVLNIEDTIIKSQLSNYIFQKTN